MDDVFSNFDVVLRAFLLTVELFVVSGVLSLVFGTLLAACRVGPVSVLARAGAVYVSVVRNTPLLVIFIFVFLALPRLDLNIDSFFVKGCLALTVYTSAFVCEAIRAGVNSVPLGQAEASRAIGFTFSQSMTTRVHRSISLCAPAGFSAMSNMKSVVPRTNPAVHKGPRAVTIGRMYPASRMRCLCILMRCSVRAANPSASTSYSGNLSMSSR